MPILPATIHPLLETALVRGHGAAPLQRQLFHRLRHAILEGKLPPGGLLPGSRMLAQTLGISRNTVTAVYEQLTAEGFLRPDRQGTKIALLAQQTERCAPRPEPCTAQRLSQMHGCARQTDATARPLRPGIPALSHFPMAAWRQALDRAWRRSGPATLGYGDPTGELALRTTIAHYLAISRGVRCNAEQVIITEGAQEALSLCVRLLTNPGDIAWVEDPGYRGARAALQGGDLRMIPKRVDAEGLACTALDWQGAVPRLIYTTPSHQYPVGAVLTVARRLALIDAARNHGAWIIEDDYDSEFRHSGEPVGAMQGLVEAAPVLYVGTFSKTMFPSLRLGFLVLPEELLAPVRRPLAEMLRGGHRHEQLAMADFIESGQFSRHLGRMKRLYRDRQHALRAALHTYLRVPHQIEGGHSGLHLTVRLPPEYPDQKIVEAAQAHGMAPQALSGFMMQAQPGDNGLVLGYGNTSAELFEPLVRRLAQLMDLVD